MENEQGIPAGFAPPPAAAPAAAATLKRLDPIAALSAGWTVFSQRAGEGLGMALIAFLASAAGRIPYFGWIVSLAAVPTLYAGFYVFALRQLRGEKPPFEAMFSGFSRWWIFAAAQLVLMVILFAVFTPTWIALAMAGLITVLASLSDARDVPWGQFLAVIPVLCMNMLFALWVMSRLGLNLVFIADDATCGPLEGLKRSWIATRGNTWRMFWLAVLACIVLFAGVLMLLVGLFVALPVVVFALAHAYEQVRENAKR